MKASVTMADAIRFWYERPPLYEKQRAAVFTSEPLAVIEASTKSGKTYACIAWLFEQAAVHGRSDATTGGWHRSPLRPASLFDA